VTRTTDETILWFDYDATMLGWEYAMQSDGGRDKYADKQ